MSKDFWQTNQYFEATINNNPNLIWYKDKDGIHKKVNDSFCKTVNKTKQQIEGQGHAYIWDVEHDDPACIESERIVMSKKQTCVSEETVKSGDGTRLLTTYKSQLYNVDGNVMGTVGVAIDITQERAYEQEIINKNHTLETIITASECGILCHTIDGSRIISVEYRVRHKSGEVLYIIGNVKLLEQNGELVYQRFLLDCTTQKTQEEKEQMEKEKRQMELVQALAIDYNLVCYFDLDTGKGGTLRMGRCRHNVLQPLFSGEITMEESLGTYIPPVSIQRTGKCCGRRYHRST